MRGGGAGGVGRYYWLKDHTVKVTGWMVASETTGIMTFSSNAPLKLTHIFVCPASCSCFYGWSALLLGKEQALTKTSPKEKFPPGTG